MHAALDEASSLLLSGPYGAPQPLLADRALYLEGVADIVRANTGAELPPVNDPVSRIIRRAMLDRAFGALTAGPSTPIAVATDDALTGARLLADGAADEGMTTPVPGAAFGLVDGTRPSAQMAHLLTSVELELSFPVTPVGAEPAKTVAEAVDLAVRLLGELASSTFEFIDAMLVIAEPEVESVYLAALPGLIIASRTATCDTVRLAEALVHESCHQKFFDLISCRSLVRPDFGAGGRIACSLPWNPLHGRRRTMDSLRMLSTLHVYSHLLLFVLSLLTAEHGSVPDEKAAEYFARATFFSTCLKSASVCADLGAGGAAMAEWLEQVLNIYRAVAGERGIALNERYTPDALDQMRLVDAGNA